MTICWWWWYRSLNSCSRSSSIFLLFFILYILYYIVYIFYFIYKFYIFPSAILNMPLSIYCPLLRLFPLTPVECALQFPIQVLKHWLLTIPNWVIRLICQQCNQQPQQSRRHRPDVFNAQCSTEVAKGQIRYYLLRSCGETFA